eukprot:CAMPEP_0119346598 /NCGR_PEP_ID=MMETSP1333-20130426/108086_1 /TAXON_ID=418940 /ORGANISM="Scyphosphaera apsteinii, Strain RCC1455" /LENGTH=55 /DNA_ID=CAMNT_0007359105 /DNA_START=526 /DNA_END=693 /DNA_ORIENTATION=-
MSRDSLIPTNVIALALVPAELLPADPNWTIHVTSVSESNAATIGFNVNAERNTLA